MRIILLFDNNQRSGCAHGSFHLPDRASAEPRESIDMRVLVMHADVEYPKEEEWLT